MSMTMCSPVRSWRLPAHTAAPVLASAVTMKLCGAAPVARPATMHRRRSDAACHATSNSFIEQITSLFQPKGAGRCGAHLQLGYLHARMLLLPPLHSLSCDISMRRKKEMRLVRDELLQLLLAGVPDAQRTSALVDTLCAAAEGEPFNEKLLAGGPWLVCGRTHALTALASCTVT